MTIKQYLLCPVEVKIYKIYKTTGNLSIELIDLVVEKERERQRERI
jgi:hypothetical protein